MELLDKLGIQWGLLLAQIVNFLIVMGVLAFFVYTPILKLLDERSERIRKAMEQARTIEDEGRKTEEMRQEKLRAIDRECGALLEDAKKRAEETQATIIARAEEEARTLIDKGRKAIAEERDRALHELTGRTACMILSLTERILAREFSNEDQRKITEEVMKEIPSLMRC